MGSSQNPISSPRVKGQTRSHLPVARVTLSNASKAARRVPPSRRRWIREMIDAASFVKAYQVSMRRPRPEVLNLRLSAFTMASCSAQSRRVLLELRSTRRLVPATRPTRTSDHLPRQHRSLSSSAAAQQQPIFDKVGRAARDTANIITRAPSQFEAANEGGLRILIFGKPVRAAERPRLSVCLLSELVSGIRKGYAVRAPSSKVRSRFCLHW